jgi:hypothetical protein
MDKVRVRHAGKLLSSGKGTQERDVCPDGRTLRLVEILIFPNCLTYGRIAAYGAGMDAPGAYGPRLIPLGSTASGSVPTGLGM